MRPSSKVGKSLVAFGTFGNALSQWAIVLVIAHSFGPETLGSYAGILAVATPVFMVGSFALRDVFLSLQRSVSWRAYMLARSVGLILSIILMSSAMLVFSWPIPLVASLSALKCMDILRDLYYGRLQISNCWLPLGALQLSNSLVSALATLATALLGATVAFVVGAAATVSLLSTLVAWKISQNHSHQSSGYLDRSKRSREVLELLRSGLPLAIAQLFSTLLLSTPIYFLQVWGTQREVGIFAAAAYIITFGNLMGSAFSTIEINRLRAKYSEGGNSLLIASALRPSGTLLVMGVLLSLVVIVFGQSALVSVYGSGFDISRATLLFICLSAVIGAIGHIGTTCLLIQNLYSKQILLSAVAFGLTVIVALCLTLLSYDTRLLAAGLVATAGAVARTSIIWLATFRSKKWNSN